MTTPGTLGDVPDTSPTPPSARCGSRFRALVREVGKFGTVGDRFTVDLAIFNVLLQSRPRDADRQDHLHRDRDDVRLRRQPFWTWRHRSHGPHGQAIHDVLRAERDRPGHWTWLAWRSATTGSGRSGRRCRARSPTTSRGCSSAPLIGHCSASGRTSGFVFRATDESEQEHRGAAARHHTATVRRRGQPLE